MNGAPPPQKKRQIQAALASAFGQALGGEVQKFVSTAGDYLLNALFGQSPYVSLFFVFIQYLAEKDTLSGIYHVI